MICNQFVNKTLVSGFWEETLFIKQGKDAHLLHTVGEGGKDQHCTCSKSQISANLFNEVNAWLKVQTKVNELPLDALLAILLLLQDKHVVVEELLKLLVGEIDAKLLEGVQLKANICKENVTITDCSQVK